MLLVKGVKRAKTKYVISVEKFADDLIMISVVNEDYKCEVPSYWRLTKTFGNPPLEIGVDCQSGLIVGITAFISEVLSSESFVNTIVPISDDVIVDTSIFSKTNDYIDVDQGYKVYINDVKMMFCFGDNQEPEKIFRSDRLELYIDNYNQIIGFSLCDLSKDEVALMVNLKQH